MSLDALDSQIENNRAQATALIETANRNLDAVKNDPRLTEDARYQDVNQIRTDLRGKLAALQEKEDTIVADKLRSLERTVLGTVGSDPTEVISYRDATERASAVDDLRTGEEMMRRALLSGDTGLAKALLNRAVERGWQTVAEAYSAENPAIGTALDDLMRLKRWKDDPQTMTGRWIYAAVR